jgi:hypothetical protein
VTPYLSRLRPAGDPALLRPRPRSRFEPAPTLPIDGLTVPAPTVRGLEIAVDREAPQPAERLDARRPGASGEGLSQPAQAGGEPASVPGYGDGARAAGDRAPTDHHRATGVGAPSDHQPAAPAPASSRQSPAAGSAAAAAAARPGVRTATRPGAERAEFRSPPLGEPLPSRAAGRSNRGPIAHGRPLAPTAPAQQVPSVPSRPQATGSAPPTDAAAPQAATAADPPAAIAQPAATTGVPRVMAQPLRVQPPAPPRPAAPRARRAPLAPGADQAHTTELSVTIGRIEVRASPAPEPQRQSAARGPRRQPPSLEQYLAARATGRVG